MKNFIEMISNFVETYINNFFLIPGIYDILNDFLPVLLFLFLLLPLFSLVISFFISIRSGKAYLRFDIRDLMIFNLFSMFILFLCSLFLFIIIILSQFSFNYNIIFSEWISIGSLKVFWSFNFDNVTLIMLIVVTIVSFLVHLYSLEYMANDPHHLKFMQYLTLFTLSMYILVTSGNYIQMFIGWEGVGVCSFLLINFWDTRILANTSAMKAIIVNRVGDFGLIFAFILMYNFFGTFEYGFIFSFSTLFVDIFYGLNLNLIVLFLFIGAVGKSAQVFLHVWLPDAMEGPTPVSALIHAATMVTAGVFLLIRSCYLVDLVPVIQKFILLVGSITAFFAGSIGIVQMDLKKVVAYSTCSQLGFMIVACGLGAYDVALFHLAMHAFFKALLFLSAGSIIHAFFYDEQDIRRLGGAFRYLPVTYTSFLIGSLALMGFPYLSGYYSKDLILELLLVSSCPISQFAILFCFLAVMCTTFYSVRLLYFVFFSYNRTTLSVLNNTHESSYFILIPLCLLSFLSLFAGFCSREMFVNFAVLTNANHTALVSNSFFDIFAIYNSKFLVIEELDISEKLLSFVIVLLVSVFTLLIYIYGSTRVVDFFMFSTFFKRILTRIVMFVHRFLIKKWYFDIIYAYLSRYILKHSYNSLLLRWDRGFLEFFGPYGFSLSFYFVTNYLRRFQNGSMLLYMPIFFILVCLCMLLGDHWTAFYIYPFPIEN